MLFVSLFTVRMESSILQDCSLFAKPESVSLGKSIENVRPSPHLPAKCSVCKGGRTRNAEGSKWRPIRRSWDKISRFTETAITEPVNNLFDPRTSKQ